MITIFLILVIVNTALSKGMIAGNKIFRVAFNTSGFFMYSIDGWNNPNDYSNSDAIVLLDTDPKYDKAYALILAAYLLGNKFRDIQINV